MLLDLDRGPALCRHGRDCSKRASRPRAPARVLRVGDPVRRRAALNLAFLVVVAAFGGRSTTASGPRSASPTLSLFCSSMLPAVVMDSSPSRLRRVPSERRRHARLCQLRGRRAASCSWSTGRRGRAAVRSQRSAGRRLRRADCSRSPALRPNPAVMLPSRWLYPDDDGERTDTRHRRQRAPPSLKLMIPEREREPVSRAMANVRRNYLANGVVFCKCSLDRVFHGTVHAQDPVRQHCRILSLRR